MIKTKIDLKRLKRTMPEIKKQFKSDLPRPLTDAIEKDILKSVSPNRSKRYPSYSKGYGQAKKKAGHPRTVNLKLTGKMLKSLAAIKRRGRPLEVIFKEEKAIYHNTTGPGGNKGKIRRILPDKRGENFNSTITRLLSNVLQNSVFKTILKNNR